MLSKLFVLCTHGRELARDARGVTAVVTGIALTVILGFAGLAIDIAAWLNATRGLQAAADQAVYSAAGAAGTNTCPNSTATAQAMAIAAANGYTNGQNDTTVSVSCGFDNTAFAVTISQIQPMWFSALFLTGPPTATRTAMAQIAGQKSDLCILALDGTNPSEGYVGSDVNAMYVTGSANIDIACGVAVDSSNSTALGVGSNSSSLRATDIYLVGDDQAGSSGFTPNLSAIGCASCNPVIPPNQILKHQRPVFDPYAARTVPDHSCPSSPTPASVGSTLSPSMGNGSGTTSTLGIFCGGLHIPTANGVNTVTVSCGTYVVAGGTLDIDQNVKVLQSNACTTGVTFILTNSRSGATDYANVSYQGNNSGKLVLTAPTSGPYSGLVFFQDRDAPNPSLGSNNSTTCGSGAAQNKISGQGQIAIVGAIYLPAQVLCFAGGSTTDNQNKCTQIIAYNINFAGNSGINSQCDGVGITAMSVSAPRLIR
jgi:Flp pilus assembly protein TadG